MTFTSDICSLVWPVIVPKDGDAAAQHTDVSGSWIVGWNPRGLSVVVACFLKGMCFSDAEAELRRIKYVLRDCPVQAGVPKYSTLQLLGYIRDRSTFSISASSPITPVPSMASANANAHGGGFPDAETLKADTHIRHMRQCNDIWLELLPGPMLGEVWCCGYRVQPCQLHVIRLDPALRYSLKPTVYSATALYSASGVRQLMTGRKPLCIPGALSNVEGVLLPDVMKSESAPRIQQQRQQRRMQKPLAGIHGTPPSSHRRGVASSSLTGVIPSSGGVGQGHLGGSFSTFISNRDSIDAHSLDGSSVTTSNCLDSDGDDAVFAREGGREHEDSSKRTSRTRRLGDADTVISEATTGVFYGGGRNNSFFQAEVGCSSVISKSARAVVAAGEEARDGASDEPEAKPGVPPRLDFPTSVDQSEMGVMLAMCKAGRNARRVASGEAPHNFDYSDTITPSARCVYGGMFPSPQPSAAATPVRGVRASINASSNTASTDATTTTTAQPQPNGVASAEDDEESGRRLQGLLMGCFDTVLQVLLLLLRLVAPLSRFSWTMGICELRLRELVNLVSLLLGRTQSCGLHPALPHIVSKSVSARSVCYYAYIARRAVDMVLGGLISALLVAGGPSLYANAQHLTRFFLYEIHMSYMDWFDGWPAGLKVNEDLNMTLCFLAKLVLECWDTLMVWAPSRWFAFCVHLFFGPSTAATTATMGGMNHALALPPQGGGGTLAEMNDSVLQFHFASSDPRASTDYLWIVPSYNVIVTMSVLGASCAAAMVADLTGLVSMHLRFLYHAVALLYRFAKALLSSLFKQFRGLKYNPLRSRIDAYDFQADQMLMATFLFTIIIFLFPTLAVYYVYFALIRVSVWLVQDSLLAVAHVVLYLPVFPLLHWFFQGPKLTGGIVLSTPVATMTRQYPALKTDGNREVASRTVEFELRSTRLPVSYVLTDFAVVVGVLVRPFAPTRVLSLIVSGTLSKPTNLLKELVPHLVADCVNPPCTLCVHESHSPNLDSKKA